MNYQFPVVMDFNINIMGFNINIMGFNININQLIQVVIRFNININKLIQVVLAYLHSLIAIYPFIMNNHSQ